MYIGIAMSVLGVYSIFSEYYEAEKLFRFRTLNKKEEVEKNEYFKLKISMGIFSISIGMLLILNYLG